MADDTNLDMQAGVPYARTIRLTDGKNTWATLAACEVRSQIRRARSVDAALVGDLTPHLTKAFDGNDIVVTLSLTGADTRTMSDGYYDMFISDTGATDANAIKLLEGQVTVEPAVTSAVG